MYQLLGIAPVVRLERCLYIPPKYSSVTRAYVFSKPEVFLSSIRFFSISSANLVICGNFLIFANVSSTVRNNSFGANNGLD